MKKILIVKEIVNGVVKIIKAIRCKMRCCCESECGKQETIKNRLEE
jgi:hypothetical protein|tara:strand:+ start:202 stop:339 length:138 start_codon:yes stop_codon:yes gene_type:complete